MHLVRTSGKARPHTGLRTALRLRPLFTVWLPLVVNVAVTKLFAYRGILTQACGAYPFHYSKSKMKRLLIASKSRLEMLQGSQSHLLYGSGISAISKQQVEADHEGQRVG